MLTALGYIVAIAGGTFTFVVVMSPVISWLRK
jgi:hypothetical protein